MAQVGRQRARSRQRYFGSARLLRLFSLRAGVVRRCARFGLRLHRRRLAQFDESIDTGMPYMALGLSALVHALVGLAGTTAPVRPAAEP